MKSIYAFIKNEGLFKLDQNTRVPSNAILRAPGISSSIEVDRSNLILEENITLNNIQVPNMKSNRELHLELVDYLKQEQITEVQTLYNHFQIYVDYSIWEGEHEVEHLSIIRPIKPIDKIMPLGVGKNNELVYRRVKTFDPVIEFGTRNHYPLGIIQNNRKNYTFQIHGIAIFQATKKPTMHSSLCENPFDVRSKTLYSALDGMVCLYSSRDEGVVIQEARVDFTPRILRLRLDIMLADMIVAYSDDEIRSILENNLENKYPVQPGEPIVPEDPKDDDNSGTEGGDESGGTTDEGEGSTDGSNEETPDDNLGDTGKDDEQNPPDEGTSTGDGNEADNTTEPDDTSTNEGTGESDTTV